MKAAIATLAVLCVILLPQGPAQPGEILGDCESRALFPLETAALCRTTPEPKHHERRRR